MVLDFTKAIDNKPLIETLTLDSLKDVLFASQYKEALKLLEQYLVSVKPSLDYKKDEPRPTLLSDNVNNIIAFVGERGTGKTSCMLTMADMLLDTTRRKALFEYNHVRETPFFEIGMIEPSYFDAEHNILSIFIAKLFQSYTRWRENNEIVDTDAVEELMNAFAETQRHLTFMLDDKMNEDDLDRLVVFSAAVDLKNDVYKLVKCYKHLLKMDDDSKLLLLVDDIDLNTEDGSRMAELIRKYFIQPNIVVFLSVKIEQLAMVKRQDFLKAYANVLERKMISSEEIEGMVERYLAKFIPQSRRIILPELNKLYDEEIQIVDYSGHIKNYPSVKECVCQLIFQKTRFLFYNTSYRVSDIVPSNLRELIQLIGMLVAMPEYWSGDPLTEHPYNKVLFKNYLFTDWIMNNIRQTQQDGVEDILREDQMALLNSKVVKFLKQQYADVLGKENFADKYYELYAIVDDRNVAYNISVGDVLAIIDVLSRKYVNEYDQRLFFLLKSLYSIRLYEAYDWMTDELDGNGRATSLDESHVLQDDDLVGLYEYDKLVGGRLVNTRLLPLSLTSDLFGLKHDMSTFLINKDHFEEIAKEVIQSSTATNDALQNGVFQFVELIMLCVFRDTFSEETKRNSKDESLAFRDKSVVVYNRLENSAQWVADMGALMYNSTRVEECYERFPWGKQYVEIAKQDPRSLLQQLVQNTILYKDPDYTLSRWKSYSCIRNTEILTSLVRTLQQTNQDTVAGTLFLHTTGVINDFQRLAAYFDVVSKFEVKSYDFIEDNKTHYRINFRFYEVYRDLLVLNEKYLQDIFTRILYKEDKPFPDKPFPDGDGPIVFGDDYVLAA